MHIRHATYADIPALMDLVSSFFANGELDGTGLHCDPDTIEFFIQDAIDSETHGVLVAEDGPTIIGFIAGALVPWMFNANIKMLCELGWFIPKTHRKTYPMAALRLLKAFKQWGRDNGATVLLIVSTVREESPRVIEMYRNMGLKHIDNNFIGRL